MATNAKPPPNTDLSADEAFEIADEMMDAATEVFHRRRDAPNLSQTEIEELNRQEMALRYDSDRYRAVGIRLLADDGSVTAQSLKDRITETNKALDKIKKLHNFLTVLASLVEFGAAIAGGNVKTIYAAGKKVDKATKAAQKDEKVGGGGT